MSTSKKNQQVDQELGKFMDELENCWGAVGQDGTGDDGNSLQTHHNFIMGIRLTKDLCSHSEDSEDYVNRSSFTLDEGSFITLMVSTTMGHESFMELWMQQHKVCLTVDGKEFVQAAKFKYKPLVHPGTYLVYGRVSWSYIMRVGHRDINVQLLLGRDGIPFNLYRTINVLPAKLVERIEPVEMYLTCLKEGVDRDVQERIGLAGDEKGDAHIWFSCKNVFPEEITENLLMDVEFRIYDDNDYVRKRYFTEGFPIDEDQIVVSTFELDLESLEDGFYRASAIVWGSRVADILFMLGKKRVGRPTMHVVKVSDRDAGQSVTDKTADDSVKAIDRIRQMIGLTSVKRHLEQNICYVKMMDARRQAGLPCGNRLMHVIMTGSPGTGKTTVARLLGKAYKEMNILSSGHTVECNRSTLVQDHIGGTEKVTKEKIEEAMGGVLFIDEAYSLLSGSQLSNDFGVRIIDTLMTVLSDPESDILVVLAGYEDEMQKLLKSNPGLASRFPVRLHFPDYSVDELMLMADDWFKDNGYQTDAKVRQRIRDVVAGAAACQSFGAGRFIHTLIQNTILPNMATRLFAKGVFGKMDSSVLSQILPQDVPAPEDVVTRLKGSEKKVRAIGFR